MRSWQKNDYFIYKKENLLSAQHTLIGLKLWKAKKATKRENTTSNTSIAIKNDPKLRFVGARRNSNEFKAFAQTQKMYSQVCGENALEKRQLSAFICQVVFGVVCRSEERMLRCRFPFTTLNNQTGVSTRSKCTHLTLTNNW